MGGVNFARLAVWVLSPDWLNHKLVSLQLSSGA